MNGVAVQEAQTDYYRGREYDESSLRYRLGSGDDIKQILIDLRGGLTTGTDGRRRYNERYRKMNEVGIASVQSFLHCIVSKIGHLTNWKNEERIMMQQRAASRAFLKELVKNMKVWGPVVPIVFAEDEYDAQAVMSECGHDYLYTERVKRQDGTVIVFAKLKVRNKDTLLISLEEAMLQSRLRAHKGKEQELTAPNVMLSEQQALQAPAPRRRFFGGLGGGKEVEQFG